MTKFDYLLNAFEHASQADEPSAHGYAANRQALFAYVRGLENRPGIAALNAAQQGTPPGLEACGNCAHANDMDAVTFGTTYCTLAGSFYAGKLMEKTARCNRYEVTS